jgi:hypothetical protein
MSFAKHGRTGANIYILTLVPAVMMPALRIFSKHGAFYCIGTIALVAVCAWANSKAIIRLGGSGKGEAMGLVSGVLAWLTASGVAKLWILANGADAFADIVRMAGIAFVSIACAFAWHRLLSGSKTIGEREE